MIRLDVWLTWPAGERIQAGELVFTDPAPNGYTDGAFRYQDSYLAHRASFPLDPAGLKLQEGTWRAGNLEPPLAVFRDALPDAWGQRLLIRRAGLSGRDQALPGLLRALAHQGLGALAFLPHGQSPETVWPDPSADLGDLNTLLVAADHLSTEIAEHPIPGAVEERSALQQLLIAGSSAGGGRPKVLVRDGGIFWIAKFPAPGDAYDIVGLEAAAMAVARLAGISVPRTELQHITTPLGPRKVLLVERFDRSAHAGGRYHMVSFATLCGERPGVYASQYGQLLEALRKYTDTDPAHQVAQLYRQIVFNALMGNTDDHLKNFLLIHHKGGYALSPAFDLLPDVSGKREHVLAFEYGRETPRREELESLGRRHDVARASQIIDEVQRAMTGFPKEAQQAGVPPAEIAFFQRDIERRCHAARPTKPGPRIQTTS